jgi:hypothetical protein
VSVLKTATGNPLTAGKRLLPWLGLVLGLGLIWIMAYVILPWGQTLPHIRPIMVTIEQADIDAGSYWYTQSEETARAQMYVRNAIRKNQ